MKPVADDEHARLGASKADQWMNCAGSLAMQEKFGIDDDNEFAREGTAAHWVLSETLSKKLQSAYYHVGKTAPNKWVVTKDMCEFVQGVVDEVRDYIAQLEETGAHVTMLVEQRVDFSDAIGVPDSFGTADIVLIIETPTATWIEAHDLKFGMGVEVVAERNKQLQLYLIGAMHTFSFLGPFDTARAVIYMPRLGYTSDWDVGAVDLKYFANEAHNAARKAVKLANLGQDVYDMLKPGAAQCKFCKARGVCPALANFVKTEVAADFDDDEEPPEVDHDADPAQLARWMAAVPLIEIWIKGVRGALEYQIFAGKKVPGWKLVTGRMGNRAWKNKAHAERRLKSFKLDDEDIYDKEVISPAQAEKMLKKIAPKHWAKLQPLITQSDGKPSVAEEDDKREAIIVGDVADDFEDLDDDDQTV